MPKLSQEAAVTTRAEVALKPRLVATLKTKLEEYYAQMREAKVLGKDIARRKVELETVFADAGEYEALTEGVRVATPFGDIPMKMITGKTKPKLNETKLMKKFKLTPKDLDSCRDKAKDKKPYLGVFLPKDKDDEGDDDGEE